MMMNNKDIIEKWANVMSELGLAKKELMNSTKLAMKLEEISKHTDVVKYINNAKKLLKDSQDGVNAFAGCKPLKPTLLSLDPKKDIENFLKIEKLGLDNVHKLAIVLVAGGLGERLGYPGIKISLPTEVITETLYIQYYIQYIKAFQDYALRHNGIKVKIPLAIMCSGDTEAATRKLLKENSNFGLEDDQITIMLQELVPALIDVEGNLALDEDGELILKPHGHGDVHLLLNNHGLVKKWMKEGKTHMAFIQDTNALALRSLSLQLGCSIEKKYAFNSQTILRSPGEKVGAICNLQYPDGKSLTINVEYNQLEPLLLEAGYGGDKPDENGNSPFPGNTNVLMIELKSWQSAMDVSGGQIPEFINPKYADSEKTKFKSPARLECMMQEFPRLLSAEDTVGCTILPRFVSFSTVKNKTEDGVDKKYPETMYSGEADLYASNIEYLKLAGKYLNKRMNIGEPEDITYKGIKMPLGPKLVINPNFSVGITDLKDRIKHATEIDIPTSSAIVLDRAVDIEYIKDGVIKYVDGEEVKFNMDHKFNTNVTENDHNYLQLRGYKK